MRVTEDESSMSPGFQPETFTEVRERRVWGKSKHLLLERLSPGYLVAWAGGARLEMRL